MSVFKIEKNRNYTVMSNYHLRDRNLSYKAKGLLSFMLSLPEDWDYTMKGLESISKESIKSIRSILHELEYNKYLIRTRMQGERGKFYYDYSIYEIPYNLSPYYQKGYTDNGNTQKDTQINTNIINTKKQIDKDDKTKISSFFVPEEHNRLTIELIDSGYIDENDIQIFSYDELFNNLLLNNNSYHELFQIIHYIVSRVKDRDFKDEDGEPIKNKYNYFESSIYRNLEKLNNPIEDLWDLEDEMER